MGISKSDIFKLRERIFRGSNSNKGLPNLNDLAEVDRLQFSHDVYRTVFEGNFSSPVTEILREGANVLDFKCGPGPWACEMSSDFNNSTFYAMETLPCFPTQKPNNVEFIESNILNNKIPFENDFFDFIFVHSSILWYSSSQYKEIVLPELIRVLKPGGYLEIMESELKLLGEGPETPVTTKYAEKFRATLRSRKINPYGILEIPGILNSTNQVIDVQEDVRKCPVGTWDSIIGEWGAKIVISLMLHTLITAKSVKKDEFDSIAKKIMNEVNKVRSYFYVHRIWAKKSIS